MFILLISSKLLLLAAATATAQYIKLKSFHNNFNNATQLFYYYKW